jgi:hypothetical protein
MTLWEVEKAIADAVASERERCAKIAETWADEYCSRPGCSAAYFEGLDCAAPDGIAAAIRKG